MGYYDQLISRPNGAGGDVNSDPIMRREELSAEILDGIALNSVVMSHAPHIQLSSTQMRIPALASKPLVYKITGATQNAQDVGLKKTTTFTFENVYINIEELAVILPIPDSVVADATIDLWGYARPLIAEAIGQKIDQMYVWGTDLTTNFYNTEGIVPDAIAAGNVVEEGSTDGGRTDRPGDLGTDMCELFRSLAEKNVNTSGVVVSPGFKYRVMGLRGVDGHPIFDSSTGRVLLLPAFEDNSENFDLDEVTVVAVDWSKYRFAIRQEVQWDMFDTGVLNDEEGLIKYNLMQQDMHAMRVTFRCGFAVAQPITPRTGNTWATRPYPAGLLVPASGTGGES